jgi:hypothetical protein
MQENTAPAARSKEESGMWILNLIGLLFFLGIAWLSYSQITKFETHGGYMSLPKPIKLIYELLGKWGVISVWLTGALYNIIKGSISYAKYR